MALNNEQLEAIAKKVNPNFVGVFSRDKLPPMFTPHECAYILNMQGSQQGDRKGTHWVALTITPHQHCFYFDSYGGPAPQDVIEYCKTYEATLKESRYRLQNLGSDQCGEYCLNWLNYITTHSPNTYHKLFTRSFSTNDKMVQAWYNAIKRNPMLAMHPVKRGMHSLAGGVIETTPTRTHTQAPPPGPSPPAPHVPHSRFVPVDPLQPDGVHHWVTQTTPCHACESSMTC